MLVQIKAEYREELKVVCQRYNMTDIEEIRLVLNFKQISK